LDALTTDWEYVRWTAIVLIMASAPWLAMLLIGGPRRCSLAQIALMVPILSFGIAAPKLGEIVPAIAIPVVCGLSMHVALIWLRSQHQGDE
jgi:hypothetical protein